MKKIIILVTIITTLLIGIALLHPNLMWADNTNAIDTDNHSNKEESAQKLKGEKYKKEIEGEIEEEKEGEIEGEIEGEKKAEHKEPVHADMMHPKFPLLDKDGQTVTEDPTRISTINTCGQCHDTYYINNHNVHYNEKVKADCIVCHFKESKMAGDFSKAHMRVQLPTSHNCAHCHGIIHAGPDPLEIPIDYKANTSYVEGEKFYNISQNTGIILSPRDISESSLNIKDKINMDYPWDIHTRRQLDCIACHFIQNDPRYCGTVQSPLSHLIKDPRKIMPPHAYIKRPNHDLNTAQCTCCHDPMKAHPDMPYKKKHMDTLSCQACHVPDIYGPAFKTVDQTVVTASGEARIELRGIDKSKSHGRSLNTQYFKGFLPFLFPHKKIPLPGQRIEPEKEDEYSISPFNLVTHWTWISKKTGKAVPMEILEKIYLSGNSYTQEIHDRFDKNGNQSIDEDELVLDTPQKKDFIKEKLMAAGIEEPVIQGKVEAYRINHGVVSSKLMKRDCSACHSEESKLGKDIVLASLAPAGIVPTFAENTMPLVNGQITTNGNGEIILRRAGVTGHYVFGHDRAKWSEQIGLIMFLMSILFVIGHGGMRYLSSRKHKPHKAVTNTVYMYGFYERLWHWTMATGVIILAVTGLEIHYSGSFSLFGLENAVLIHNILAAILVINAALSLFYHLATGKIRQFFGFNKAFIKESLVQAYYYSYGIFKGSAHPVNKTPERKLNPLQQLTYIGLLNVLMPFQVITGILIALGFTVVGPIHHLGSWMFIAFVTAHVYLTSTGETLTSNITAMITGYDEVSVNKPDPEQEKLKDMKTLDLVGTLIKQALKKSPETPETTSEATSEESSQLKSEPIQKSGKDTK